MIDVDVLIVGGGAQSLWLLRDLTKHGYKTILLERRELGGGQTCHSHGLIHRGHYYDNVDMMIVLNAAAQFWQAFIAEKGIAKLNVGRALAGFGAGTEMKKLTTSWTTAGLEFEQCAAPPDVFTGGTVKKVFFETGEFSLDPSEVIESLADDQPPALATPAEVAEYLQCRAWLRTPARRSGSAFAPDARGVPGQRLGSGARPAPVSPRMA
jgi:glycine/D-amino acid oxidase-like deaminating enzyme